ncbi:hypothetical protein [Luteipulveratus flavus]|uniref:ParB/Sulfiredoxin domain-containing protein n=1 Tax=Luteipulveratus flavus TaxID=3031728 RepID=A0ABT6C3Z9_9MICO|nr:hypothetical protein [Luteipulveratus sp. YIM 133296]MDF8263278.1 hypothetical protein [Luteipulveratus sp. YIM 133296]
MQWPIEMADLGQLVLDPLNVRVREGQGDGLTSMDGVLAEEKIAGYMLAEAKLLDLIHSILRDGYLDNEIPVATSAGDGKGLIVLEGNRRITALKVIQRPELLGPEAAKVERLKSRYPGNPAPTQIRVMLAPSRAAAQPLLARLHIGQAKEPWIREQQAIFFHSQLSDDLSVDDLRIMYPAEKPGEIRRLIMMGEMRDMIRSLDFPDDALRDFVLTSKLKMTVFEYVYRPKKLSSALGLDFNRDGLLPTKNATGAQQRALLYVLGRLESGTLNTRSPDLIAKHEGPHEAFVGRLRRIMHGEDPGSDAAEPGPEPERQRGAAAPGEGARGSGSADEGGTGGKGASSGGSEAHPKTDESAPGATRGPNRGDTKSRLNMTGFEYAGTSAGVRRRFEEVGRIDVRDFPNATHDLLRTILECAIKDFFKAEGDPFPPKATIGNCIEKLSRHFQSNFRMTALINGINRKGRMGSEQYAGTADALNAANHEPDHFVDAREVHASWEKIKPIVIEIIGKKSGA